MIEYDSMTNADNNEEKSINSAYNNNQGITYLAQI